MLLLARAVDRREDWVAAAIGTGAVIVSATMSNYYFAVLVPFELLWLRREGVGAALCALSAVTLWIGWSYSQYDEIYARVSLATLVFVLGATAALGFARASEPEHRGEAGAKPEPAP